MKKIYLVIWFACLVSALNGQNRSPSIIITENYNQLGFNEFIGVLEEKYKLQIFYFGGWISDLYVSQDSSTALLDEILSATLADTDYKYFIHPNRQIILTLGQDISGHIIYSDSLVEINENYAASESQSRTTTLPRGMTDFTTDWITIGDPASPEQKPRVEFSGTITEVATGMPLEGAIVYVEELTTGVTSDSVGHYEISLPQGRYTIVYQSVNLKEKSQKVQIYKSGQLDVGLEELILNLQEVVVSANRKEGIVGIQMSIEAIKTEEIKELPTLLGEVDIIRSALMLPGVQSVGEFSSGINVRGGGSDQNMTLLNGAPVYNASHLFGFSSSFSPDVIDGLELYKSSIPVKYGGRISSVLDIQMKDGDLEKWSLKGGISPVTSRITVEGPIKKDKTSLIVSGRSTYSDWILNRLENASFRNSKANYGDLSAHLSTKTNAGNRFDISGYISNDYFQLNADTTYSYQNRNVSANYLHAFSDRLYGTFSAIYSHYRFNVNSEAQPIYAFELDYKIDDIQSRAHFSYAPNDDHQVNFGINLTHYRLDPGNLQPALAESVIEANHLDRERAIETGLYASDEWTVTSDLSVYAGLRFNSYMYLGPRTVFNYIENAARLEQNIVSSTLYEKGDLIKAYQGLDYRLSMRYSIDINTSIKGAFNRTHQYLSMLFNSATASPTAIWKLSDTHILPQSGDQFSLGFYKNFLDDRLEFSVESYYKIIQDMIDYKGGAKLLLNEHLETDVVNGQGKAYGVEVLLKKHGRKLNGWLSYSYSRSMFRGDSPYFEDRINQGKWFPSNFDKPHDFSLVGYYKVSQRFSFSGSASYSTGRPITIPVAKYQFGDGVRLQYSRRNEFRVPDYFRLDFSINLEGNHKKRKLAHNSWSLSIYNLTGRKNVYSIYFVSDGVDTRGYKLSIFGQPIVTITYNFKI